MKSTLAQLVNVATITPNKKSIRVFRGVVAGIMILLAVAQLFTFEDFPELLNGLWESSGAVAAHLLAIALVTCEVFAVPFLLAVPVSPLVRLVSMACGWLVGVLWVLIASWQLGTPDSQIVGILGASAPFPGRGLLFWVSIILALLVAYATLVVWPSKTRKD